MCLRHGMPQALERRRRDIGRVRRSSRGCVSASVIGAPGRIVRLGRVGIDPRLIPSTAQYVSACHMKLMRQISDATYRGTPETQLANRTPQLVAITLDVHAGTAVRNNNRIRRKCTAHGAHVCCARAALCALCCRRVSWDGPRTYTHIHRARHEYRYRAKPEHALAAAQCQSVSQSKQQSR